MKKTYQYVAIVRDAKNVMVHAVHFAAFNDDDAVTQASYYVNPNSVLNGIDEQTRVKKYALPFRFNVGQR